MAAETKNTTLTIRILGRDYAVSCPDDEREALLSSAEFLSRRMQAIRKKGKTLGVDRIAVMAALNTARELLRLEQENTQLRNRLHNDGVEDDAAPLSSPSALDKQTRERLAQMQLRIEAALDDQA
ncbi:MAG TPA: cell division protein ZapA [Salinisphaeraceae bacterium]|nr:cell division protein ZapA [Salinisphaeraceae bacterium]